MNAQVSIENIDPKKAQHYLARLLDGQRPVRDNHVLRLGMEIESGNWHLTGDALILVKGKVANGQHRLHAIILADKPAHLLVLQTDDEEVYKVLDSGIGRSVGDALTFIGVGAAKDIAAVAMLVVQYDYGGLTMMGRSNKNEKITRSMIIDYVENHRKALEAEVQYCINLRATKNIISSSLSGALLHLANRSGKGDAKTFISNLYLGGSEDAAFDLRERLIRSRGTKYRMNRSYTFGLMIKAYKSFVQGTRPGVLKIIEGEAFPKMP